MERVFKLCIIIPDSLRFLVLRFIDKEKVFKTGFVFLGITFTFSLSLILLFEGLSLKGIPTLGKKMVLSEAIPPLKIPFDLPIDEIPLPVPNIEREIAFSRDLPRPDSPNSDSSVYVIRLKKNSQTKKVTLPARIDLRYEKSLRLTEDTSSFWVEIEKGGLVHVHILDMAGENREIGTFQSCLDDAPIRSSQDFSEGSPLWFLAESRLLGKDLFLSKYAGGSKLARLEIGGLNLQVKEGDLLRFKEGKWEKVEDVKDTKGAPVARIGPFNEKNLEFQAWGLDEYSRLCISSVVAQPFNGKVEEILTSVRIRSEKQISCMLDKQCFVLKAGDFVLKTDNRWKVLRKPEEKEAYIRGEVEGEIFVFDRIDQKGGQKVLYGSIFDSGRSQVLPVEYVASTQKKGSKGKK